MVLWRQLRAFWAGLDAWQAFGLSVTLFILAGVIGLALTVSVFRVIRGILKRIGGVWADGTVILPILRPLRLLMPVICMRAVMPALAFQPETFDLLADILRVLFIAGVAWVFISLMEVARLISINRFDDVGRNDLHARSVRTRYNILQSIVSFLIVIMAMGFILLTFDRVRAIGQTVLASAGVAGIILGFAAQRSLGSILAGIQIALAQPIRLGDVVVVENEFGTIEEITLTYVVVAIWDQRRIVLPITYFIEKPFINYTRSTSEILGTVFWYVDYRTPVEQVRKRFEQIVRASEKWDRRVVVLQVTNITGDTMELRGLVSARDTGAAWDLRCEIREKVMAYLTHELPGSLPKRRAEVLAHANGHDDEGTAEAALYGGSLQ